MVDIYVLNGDLEPIAIIDNYTSLIWATRYDKVGDCELYIEATTETFKLLKKGNYLSRHDDDMVCRIESIELDTNSENGNFLIVTAYDVKKILQQRVVWSTVSVDGNTEDYIRSLVYNSLVAPALYGRQIKNASGRANFLLGNKAGFKQVTTEQVSYKKVSEKVEEVCQLNGWGYKVVVDIGNFYFLLYEGTDRSKNVIFSPNFENLISTTYKEDSSDLANVALVGGEGEGSARSRNVAGYAEGLNRNEIFVDARDISRSISWDQLLATYPAGSIYPQGAATFGYWRMDYINVPYVDAEQFRELKVRYPNGQEITLDGNLYWQTYDADIAVLQRDSATEEFKVTLLDIVYNVYLINRGYEKLSEFGSVISFDGSVEPHVTFEYKKDYFLGDLVTVKNEFDIEAIARITEVIEVYDLNGYSIEPKFEYKKLVLPTRISYISTEEPSSSRLTTESGNYLTTEGEKI